MSELSIALLLTSAVGLGMAQAQVEVSEFPTDQARGYIGEWSLATEYEGEPAYFLLTFFDVDGKLGATIRSSERPQPIPIADISKVSRGLLLKVPFLRGEAEIVYDLVVRHERDLLVGSLGPTEGKIRAEVRAEKGGKVPGRSVLLLADTKVKVTFGSLRMPSEDFERLEAATDGEVFEFVGSRATKLFTDSDLRFGDQLIAAGNAAPNYPGVYSLWLKKVAGGWHLVFNEEPDVWGTQHNPEADVAEVPLRFAKVEDGPDRFDVELLEADGSGVLRLGWGPHEWRAEFQLAQN